MKQYDATKISHEFTNLDYARQFYPKTTFDDSGEYPTYVLNKHWSIVYLNNEENFTVDYTYYDHSVGYVTDDDVFSGNFGQCIDFVLKQTGKG